MKSTHFIEVESVKLDKYTLVLPSVSVGNVGQLAVDLLLHNLPCRLVGAFDHPSVLALVGNLPEGPAATTRLFTSLEAFVCESKKLLIFQIRAPISPRGRLSLVADLLTWAADRGVVGVVQLASSHASVRPDPAAAQLCRLATAAADTAGLDGLAPLQPLPSDGRPHRVSVPGAGFVPDFYHACEERGLPYICLLRHTYEGNNAPEAVDLCNCLDAWLGLLSKESTTSGPLGRWKTPPTWSHLFGSAPDRHLF